MIEKIKYFKDKPVLADVLDLVVVCVITVIVAKLLTSFIVLTGHVPTGSMETLIMPDDRILANRTAYWESGPERGDIVVFFSPDDKAAGEIKYFVKRVIGLPGETVTIKDNHVYINGIALDEPYLDPNNFTNGNKSYDVPEGHYFMLGDNRKGSADSREWDRPFVPMEDIKGEVFFKYHISFRDFNMKVIHSYNDYE